METKQRGSAIVMVLIIVAAITTLAASALKINGLIGQLVIERGQEQKKRAALEALALYSIALGYQQLQSREKPQKPITKKFDRLPVKISPYQGIVTVVAGDKQWVIQAQIGQNNEFHDTITAHINPCLDGWAVSHWNYAVK